VALPVVTFNKENLLGKASKDRELHLALLDEKKTSYKRIITPYVVCEIAAGPLHHNVA
jgi:hypothetical protein